MPIYEVVCKNCNKKFEVWKRINDMFEKCQYCGGEVQQVFSVVSAAFHTVDDFKNRYKEEREKEIAKITEEIRHGGGQEYGFNLDKPGDSIDWHYLDKRLKEIDNK